MTHDSPPSESSRILVVDDQRNMRATTALLLRADGYSVLEASNGEDALSLLSQERVDLLLADLKMEPMDGLRLLEKALAMKPGLQVIIMTAFGSIESAVEAMRLGAFGYIAKPFRDNELHVRVRDALSQARLRTTVEVLASEFQKSHDSSVLVGRSPAMARLTALLVRAARSDVPILIEGECGTGKELVARALHTHSQREDEPFVSIHCAGFTEPRLETELFGHAEETLPGRSHSQKGSSGRRGEAASS